MCLAKTKGLGREYGRESKEVSSLIDPTDKSPSSLSIFSQISGPGREINPSLLLSSTSIHLNHTTDSLSFPPLSLKPSIMLEVLG